MADSLGGSKFSVGLNTNIFYMIFHKYLRNADITSILEKLIKKHKEINPEVDVSLLVEGYLSVILKLIHAIPNSREEIIHVSRSDGDGYDEPWDGLVRVLSNNQFHGRMLDIYFWENGLSIEDVMGMEVQTKYGVEDVCYYIIWELTFCGFNPEDFGNMDNLK